MGRVAKETFSGLKWQFLQKLTLQPLQLVFMMFLARLITPEEFGILGLTAIFFGIANNLASCGFATALIRKQDRTDEDINTVFWFNVIMSFLMGGILFLSAPLFVDFFNQPALLWLTRASAIMMFLNSFAGVHFTLYNARRDFKTPAIIHTSISIISMPICVSLAYMGWGYWALMTQGIFNGLASLTVIWIVSPWKPRFMFSKKSFKEFFSFGSKLALSGILDGVYNNAYSLIIGKFYSPADLAYYSKGARLAAVMPTTACAMISNITFPILATLQDDNERLKNVYRKYIKLFTFAITWLCLCVAAYSKPYVAVMYGEQWAAAVPYTCLICFSYAIWHMHVINLNLIQVKGRSDLFLKLEVYKKILSFAILLYCATISVLAIAIGGIITGFGCYLLNTMYSKRLINMSIWEQLMDFIPLFLFANLTTWPVAYLILQLPILPFFQLALGGTASALIYFFILYFCKNETLNDFLKLMQPRVPTHRLKLLVAYFIR